LIFPDSKISIEIRNSVSHFLNDSIDINEEEFEAAFQTALTKIQNIQL
jgi:hypothetical protein